MPDHARAYDLATLRVQIDKLNDRILMRLHDRAGLPRNRAVYEPGAIPLADRPGASLLEFAIEGFERYHASLGRYEYPDQVPLMLEQRPGSTAARVVELAPPPPARIAVRERLLAYYVGVLLPMLCAAGDDPSTYGETAYVDADLLELLHERIHTGRFVALAKRDSDPSLAAILDDAAALRDRLRDARREEAVLADVAARALRYGIAADVARALFRWVIGEVLEFEVVYLQRLAGR